MPLDYKFKRYSNFTGGMTDNYLSGNDTQYELAENLLITDDGTLKLCFGFHGLVNGDSTPQPITGLFDGPDGLRFSRDADLYILSDSDMTETVYRPLDWNYFTQSGSTEPCFYSAVDDLTQTGPDNLFTSGVEYGDMLICTHEGGEYPIVAFTEDRENLGVLYQVQTVISAGLPKVDPSDFVFKQDTDGNGYGDKADLKGSGFANAYLYKFVSVITISIDGVDYRIVGPESDIIEVDATTDIDQSDAKTHIQISGITRTNISETEELVSGEYYKIYAYRTEKNGSTFYYVGYADYPGGFGSSVSIIDFTMDDPGTSGNPALNSFEGLYTNGGIQSIWHAPKCKYLFSTGDVIYYLGIQKGYSSSESIVGAENLEDRIYQGTLGASWGVNPSNYIQLDATVTGGGGISGVPVVFTENKSYRIDGKINTLGQGYMKTITISESVGCIDHASIVSTSSGLYFAAKDGFYVTDGYQVRKITDSLTDRYRDHIVKSNSKYKGEWNPVTNTPDLDTLQLSIGDYFRVSKTTESGTPPSPYSVYGVIWKSGDYAEIIRDHAIGEGLDYSYLSRQIVKPNGRNKVIGTIDKDNSRIYWRVSPNYYLVYDIMYNAFTAMASEQAFDASSLLGRNGDVIRGDSNGNIFAHTERDLSYVLPNPGAFSTWATYAIPYKFMGISDSMGSPHVTKWAYGLTAEVSADVNSAIGLGYNSDNGKASGTMKQITVNNTVYWDDDNIVWGDPDFTWGSNGFISAKRRFPKGGLRFKRRQVIIEAEDSIVENSDRLGTASISAYGTEEVPQSLQVVLDGGGAIWPEDVTGYEMSFSSDNYAGQYPILSRLDDSTILIGNTGADLLNNVEWYMIGKRKEQGFELLSYTVKFAPLSDEGGEYNIGEDNSNE